MGEVKCTVCAIGKFSDQIFFVVMFCSRKEKTKAEALTAVQSKGESLIQKHVNVD